MISFKRNKKIFPGLPTETEISKEMYTYILMKQ